MNIEKEKEAFEAHMAEKYKNLMDRRQCLNNGGGYMAWDMNVAWQVWQAAKAQAVPEWISVEDKLPTENGNYLVCIDGDVFYLTAKWVKNHFKFLARGYGLTEDFTDWRYCEGVKVTHWMTLPAAPQEQNQ